jgi:T4 RnlA family RNA ligase
MKVVEYIKTKGLDALDEFGIILKKYPEGLIVLNYNQIESPKTNPMVIECRGLILDGQFNVVSRSFDRFFNYGENGATFNPSVATVYEKIDGSLIKIYFYKGTWYVSTRGTAFAESKVNGFDITFQDMVYKALEVSSHQEFNELCCKWLSIELTYIFEVTGFENRVVTRYSGYSLWFLSARNNKTGEYHSHEVQVDVTLFGAVFPKRFKFDSIEACIDTAKSLPDLQEGYVAYHEGVPVCKIKSPTYVAVHHIRGEGLSPKRIAEIVVLNEQDEYLKYFPEDEQYFKPYVEALEFQLKSAQHHYCKYKNIQDQKEFALSVIDLPYSHLLFQARKTKEDNIQKVFNSFPAEQRAKFLLTLV